MRNFAKKKYEAGTACSLLQVSAGIGLTAVTSTSSIADPRWFTLEPAGISILPQLVAM